MEDTSLTSGEFQSTLPVWGATPGAGELFRQRAISIHAPRVGSDFALNPMSPGSFISIHAPRVGSDCKSR